MDIQNTLVGPQPKFHLGQKVAWYEGGKVVSSQGLVVGMRYLSPLHRVAAREKISQGDIGWRYEISVLEGRSLDDLAENWGGGDPLIMRMEYAVVEITPPEPDPLEEIRIADSQP